MLQWWYKIKGKTGVVGLVVAGFPRKIEKFKYSQAKKVKNRKWKEKSVKY